MSEQCRSQKIIPIAIGVYLLSWVGEALWKALFSGFDTFLPTLASTDPGDLWEHLYSALLIVAATCYILSVERRRLRLAHELRHAENLRRALLEASEHPVCILTRDGQILGKNGSFSARFPLAGPESRLRPLGEVMPGGLYRDAALGLVQRCAETGKPGSGKIERLESDGVPLHEEIQAIPIASESGGAESILLVIRDLALRQRHDALVRVQQAGLRGVLEHLPAPAAIQGANGTLRLVNRAFEELTGYGRDELEDRLSLAQLAAPECREEMRRHVALLLGNGGPLRDDFHCRIEVRSGGEKYVAGGRGSIAGSTDTVISLSDRSSQLQVEEALRESLTTLDLVQRISRMGNWDWDIVNDTLIWSDQMYRIYGVEPEEFTPTHEAALQAVHPEDKATVIQAINDALYNKKPFGLDHRIVLPGDLVRTISSRAEVTFDAEGNPLRMVGTNQDVSWRVEAEEALRGSEQKFSKAFHASPDSIVITRADDGSYIDVNEAFQEMTGYTREEVLGRSSYSDLKLWADPDARMMMLKLMNQYGHVRNLEVRFRVKSGEIRELLWSADVIEYQGEACLIAISRDVTEQRHLEQELLKSEAKLYMKHEELKNLFQQMEGIRREWEETMDSISDLFILADNWGKIRRFNRAVEEFSGRAHRDIVGRDYTGFIEELGMAQHLEAPGVELLHPPTGRRFVLKRYDFPSIDGDGTTREVVIISDTTGMSRCEHRPRNAPNSAAVSGEVEVKTAT